MPLPEGTDACFAPVLNWDEAPEHRHNRARDTFVDIDGVMQPAPAPRFSRTPAAVPKGPAPVPGAHSDAILLDRGISKEWVEQLKAAGAI